MGTVTRVLRGLCRGMVYLIIVFVLGSLFQMAVSPLIPAYAKPTCNQDPWQSPSCVVQSVTPHNPFSVNCKNAPAPQMPGSGLSGSIDSGVPHPDPNAPATDIYGTIGFPSPWHTYDLGCGGGITDSGSVLDTTIGNWIKGVATSLVAMTNSLHRFVSPPTFLDKFDPALTRVSDSLHTALFVPYIGLSLVVIAIGLIISSRRGNIPLAVTTVAWALAVLAVATALWNYPVKAGHLVDRASTGVISSIDRSLSGTQANGDAASGRAELLVDNVLYEEWLQGELGSASSPAAKKHGLRLLGDQAYTYTEAAKIAKDPNAGAKIAKAKQADFVKAAGDLQKHYPDAYTNLKGQGVSRIGAATVSLFAAASTTPFMLVSDFLQVVALFIVRIVVMMFPAIAVIGIFYALRAIILSVLNRSLGGVINAAVFAAGAAVNTVCVGVLFDPGIGIPQWAAILLSFVMTYVLWRMFKPFRRLNGLVSPSRMVMGEARLHHRRHSRFTTLHRIRSARRMEGIERHLEKLTAALTHGGVAPVAAGAAGAAATTTHVPMEAWTPTASPAPAPVPIDVRIHIVPEAGGAAVRTETAYDMPGAGPQPALGGDVETLPNAEPPIHLVDEGDGYVPGPPREPYRADPVVVEQGGQVWRIWDPQTGKYEVVEPPEEGLSA